MRNSFGAVFLETPRIAEDVGFHFRQAAGRRLEVIQFVVVEVTAQTAHLDDKIKSNQIIIHLKKKTR